jgi:hypothetical protein
MKKSPSVICILGMLSLLLTFGASANGQRSPILPPLLPPGTTVGDSCVTLNGFPGIIDSQGVCWPD